MIKESQIINFNSEDFRKKWFLLKISEYFYGEITLENFELLA